MDNNAFSLLLNNETCEEKAKELLIRKLKLKLAPGIQFVYVWSNVFGGKLAKYRFDSEYDFNYEFDFLVQPNSWE